MSAAIKTALQKNRFGVPELLYSLKNESSCPNAPPNSLKEATRSKTNVANNAKKKIMS